MIAKELEGKVLRLHHVEKWPPGTIATQLGLHHDTVERVLSQDGQLTENKQITRPSMVDPYLPFMVKTLEEYPRIQASRLYEMVKERGYPGGPDHFRHVVARYRPRRHAEAYLRLRTLPAEQTQADWGHFGKVSIGRAKRTLMAFVMVLSWCRMIFLRFFLNQRMSNFLQGHVEAFDFFGGVSKQVLYDNLKSAVVERQGDAIRFNPTLLEFAGHYRYEPRPVAKARGNEKGRVERAIRFVRGAFFTARKWKDLDDLNAQALAWCRGPAAERKCPEDLTMTVREAYEQERSNLLPLPKNPFPTDERVEVSVGKTPYVRYDLNDYSVPHDMVRRSLVVTASEKTVRILDGNQVVAEHQRSYDRRAQVENLAHIKDLERYKRDARHHRGMDRLQQAVPESRELMTHLAQRGTNLGSSTVAMLRLLDHYGASELHKAVMEALDSDVPHPNSVRHILERNAHQRGVKPPVPVALPNDPRVRNLTVRTHDLKQYDELKEETSNEPKNEKSKR